MALDKNPRTFWVEVTEVEANVIPEGQKDHVIFEVAGKLLPTTQERIVKAINSGEYEFKVKTLT